MTEQITKITKDEAKSLNMAKDIVQNKKKNKA